MASIGEQIRDARKAKGMTQDALADELHVSRSTLANYEAGRRMPDGETLLRLSAVLGHSFESNSADNDAPASGDDAPVMPPAEAKRGFNKTIFIICGAVLACLLLALILLPRSTARERAYKSPTDGETYTIARFQREAANDANKPYLRLEPALTVNRGDNFDYWMFDVACHEMNGIALSVDRVEQVFFARDKANVEQILTAVDLRAFGLDTDIAAYGDWSFQGGLPVQDTALGVGVLLRCTSEQGEALAFTVYIPLSA